MVGRRARREGEGATRPARGRHARWTLAVWVEDGQVRGRVAATPDVGVVEEGSVHLAGVEPICGALRTFLDGLVAEADGAHDRP